MKTTVLDNEKDCCIFISISDRIDRDRLTFDETFHDDRKIFRYMDEDFNIKLITISVEDLKEGPLDISNIDEIPYLLIAYGDYTDIKEEYEIKRGWCLKDYLDLRYNLERIIDNIIHVKYNNKFEKEAKLEV